MQRRPILIAISLALVGCQSRVEGDACPLQRSDRSCVLIGSSHERRLSPAPAHGDAHDDEDSGVETVAVDAAMPVLATHTILEGELRNARDLGGVPVAGDAKVAYGELFRGPPPLLSETGCAAFAQLGVRTIVDLRTDEERAAAPDSACALQEARLVPASLPVPYNVSPADYIADLDTAASIAAAFAVLGDDAAYPVYFHCTWGRDRTGVLAAVILRALGASREDVMQEYLLSEPNVGAYPDSLAAVLDEIERRGGVEAYLAAFDVGKHELATLRKHALHPAPR